MALEKERDTFYKNVSAMLEHEGRYVVISGDRTLDFFDSYEDALSAAYREFGPDSPFLVKKISMPDCVYLVTPPIDLPCRP